LSKIEWLTKLNKLGIIRMMNTLRIKMQTYTHTHALVVVVVDFNFYCLFTINE